jgi:fucose permease
MDKAWIAQKLHIGGLSMNAQRPRLLLVALAYIGFVSLGLPDAVIGVAWPSVRAHFTLPQEALGLIFIAAGCGYFSSSFFSGRLVQSLGIGRLLAGSTALVAAGGFGFAVAPLWAAFVLCAVLHGLGSGAIDAGLNGFAAARLSARHMNWLHACYCLGAMLGPLVMTGVLAAGSSYSAGYAGIASILFIMAILFFLTRRLWAAPAAANVVHSLRESTVNSRSELTTLAPTGPLPAATIGTWTAVRHPAVLMHMAVFFLYTGLEVTVGQWSFTMLTESRAIDPVVAGAWVSGYWGSIGVGRVLFGFLVDRIGIDGLLRACLLAAVLGAVLIALPGPLTFAGLVLTGLGLAPVFPCLMTRTPQRLGADLATHAVGFQVGAAMIGAAVIPAAVGLAVGRFGLETVGPAAIVLAAGLWALHEALA